MSSNNYLDGNSQGLYQKFNQLEEKRKQAYSAQQARQESESKPWYEKAWDTTVDVFGNIGAGITKFGEGIVDGAAGLAGTVGGWFGADTSGIEDFIKYDFTGENVIKPLNDYADASILGDTAKGVFQGVGQMLPSIVTTALTGGATAGAVLPTLVVSSGGTGVESALTDGADMNRAMLYGGITGGLEGVMEKVTGGVSRIASVGGKTAVKGIGRNIVKEGLSEAFEEGVQEALDPLVQTTYKGSEALEGYKDPNFLKNVGQSALIGGLSGGLVQGMGQGLNIVQAGGINEFKAHDYELRKAEIDVRLDKLQAEGKLTDEVKTKLLSTKRQLNERLDNAVSGMDIERQKKFKKNKKAFNLSEDFDFDNEKGFVRKNVFELGSDTDSRYYSASLTGNERVINEKLKEQGTSVFNGELSEAEQTNYNSFKKVFNAMNEKSVSKTRFVIAEKSDKFNSYLDKSTIVIGKDMFESGEWRKKLVHEVAHFKEGTKSFREYANYILKETDTTDAEERILRAKYTVNLSDGKAHVITESDVESIKNAINGKQELTSDQMKIYDTYVSEVVAHQTENVLGNEESINRLVKGDRNIAQKIYDRIKKFIDIVKAKSPEEKDLLQILYKSEKLFDKALKSGGVVSIDNEKTNAVSSNGGKFSIKEIDGKKIVVIDTDQEIFDGIEKKDYANAVKKYMRDNFRGKVVNGIELNTVSEKEYTNSVYSKTAYNKNEQLYKNKMRAAMELDNIIQTGEFLNHEEAKHQHSYNVNGYDRYSVEFSIDNKLFSGEMLVALGKDKAVFYDIIKIRRSDSTYRANHKDFSESVAITSSINNIRQSEGKVNSIEEKNPKGGKFSLKDSRGDNLTKEQAEFFKDSKVRDSEGNLLVTYHGTSEKFNVFDITKSRSWDERLNYDLPGFYFSESAEESGSYGDEKAYFINVESPYNGNVYNLAKEKGSYRKAYEYLVSKGYDGMIINDMGEGFTEIIVFNPNQIKLTTNKTPTENEDIRFSRKYTPQNTKLNEELTKKEKILQYKQNIHDRAVEFDEIKKRTYESSSALAAPEMKALADELSKWKWKKGLDKKNIFESVKKVSQIYNKKNILLYDKDNAELTYLDENVLNDIEFIKEEGEAFEKESSGTYFGELTFEELQACERIQLAILHLYRNYDTVLRKGRRESVTELASDTLSQLDGVKSRNDRSSFFKSVFGKFGDFARNIIDPRAVISQLEGYQDGNMTKLLIDDITDGETKANKITIDLLDPFEKFFKENKGYKKRLVNDGITLANGDRLNVDKALQLYLTAQRQQAQTGIYNGGISIEKDGQVKNVKLSESDITDLYGEFSVQDKQFIEIAHNFFNEHAKNVKTATDVEILGYTNVSETNDYIPIRRDKTGIAKNFSDLRAVMADFQNVHNFSFNKAVKENSKNEICINGLYSVVQVHAAQMGIYAGLTTPLKNFNMVYNKNLGTSDNIKSVRKCLNREVWKGTDEYVTNYLQDVQSASRQKTTPVLSALRRNYVQFQLGANPKTVVSQVSSYPMAFMYIDTDCLAKGLFKKVDDKLINRYSDFAIVRTHDKSVVKAEGVIDKVGKAGNVLTQPIQFMDRKLNGKIFNACCYQVQKDKGLKFGTEENYGEAAVLFEKISRETQSNSFASEKSAMMRSSSEIVRGLTMFMSDAMKQCSRVVQSAGEYLTIKNQIKNGNSGIELKERLKASKKKLARCLSGMTVSSLFYVLLGMGVKWLFNREEKDDKGEKLSFGEAFLKDYTGNLAGMLPIVKDVYGFFSDGYEVDNYALGMINDMLEGAKGIAELTGKLCSGENLDTQEYMRPLRKLIYAVSQMTGLPVRNINNYVSGLVGRFDPAMAYKYNNLFYESKTSKSDLQRAVNNGNDRYADSILDTVFKNDRVEVDSSIVRNEILNLYKKGEEAYPRTVGDKVRCNGVDYEFDKTSHKKFMSVYSEANAVVEKVINQMEYKKLDIKSRAKAIKSIYDAYYNKAISKTFSVPIADKTLLVGQSIEITKLIGYKLNIDAIKSESGEDRKSKVVNYIENLRLTKNQKYLLLGYAGYKVPQTQRQQLKLYINALKLKKEEKQTLFKMCGFDNESKS